MPLQSIQSFSTKKAKTLGELMGIVCYCAFFVWLVSQSIFYVFYKPYSVDLTALVVAESLILAFNVGIFFIMRVGVEKPKKSNKDQEEIE